MKIYEKPSVNIRMFDVEDIMNASTTYAFDEFNADTAIFQEITGDGNTAYAGVAFEW